MLVTWPWPKGSEDVRTSFITHYLKGVVALGAALGLGHREVLIAGLVIQSGIGWNESLSLSLALSLPWEQGG